MNYEHRSKYRAIKTTDIGTTWKGDVSVNNVRRFPKNDKK